LSIMKVPLLDLKAQLDGIRDEILTAVTKVIDSTRYIQGPEVEGLEKSIASYCGTGFAIGVSSGTDALLISLMTLGIGQGDLVLTTPYSFFATMGVILRVGAKPVFADIDPVTYNIDPEAVEEILEADTNRKIKAILPVHLYGQCADMKPLLRLAEKYDLQVIEDAAQAIGAEYPFVDSAGKKWLRAGSMGLAGCFSFFPSKNLGGIGDGGMVVTQDSSFAEKLSLMRNHGAYPKYYHSLVGGNFRLDPIQATVLRIKLKHLEDWHQSRRKNASIYQSLFAESGLQNEEMVSVPRAVYKNQQDAASSTEKNFHIFNQYILRVKKRDQLKEWLQQHNIGCEIYYPLALHQQGCLGNQFDGVKLPRAEEAAAQTIALPIYPELTFPMQEYVVQTIADFYKQA
jgi:dTDP-4-amino-4,6-dideoxygalactose transaminase